MSNILFELNIENIEFNEKKITDIQLYIQQCPIMF